MAVFGGFYFELLLVLFLFVLSNGSSLIDNIMISNIYMVENYDFWIYKCEILNVVSTYELVEVYVSTYSNPTKWIQGYQMHYSGNVYYFDIESNDDIPLNIMLVSKSGETLIKYDIITSFEISKTFDFGTNFISNTYFDATYEEISITSISGCNENFYGFSVNLEESTVSKVYLSNSENSWFEAELVIEENTNYYYFRFDESWTLSYNIKIVTNNDFVIIKYGAITSYTAYLTLNIGFIAKGKENVDIIDNNNEHDWCLGYGDLCPNKCDSSPCNCEYDSLCKSTTCHSNGCDECITGAFKMDYEYPCGYCLDTAGPNCIGCHDFTGCYQCKEGYTLEKDYNCRSPKQNPMEYCRPNYCSNRRLTGLNANEELRNRLMNLEKQ